MERIFSMKMEFTRLIPDALFCRYFEECVIGFSRGRRDPTAKEGSRQYSNQSLSTCSFFDLHSRRGAKGKQPPARFRLVFNYSDESTSGFNPKKGNSCAKPLNNGNILSRLYQLKCYGSYTLLNKRNCVQFVFSPRYTF